MTFKQKIISGCSILLFLMVSVSTIVYFNVVSLLKTTSWVDHTHDVIAHTNLLAKCMVDMETGQRGFILTGSDDFLEPFHSGKELFDSTIIESEKLVRDNQPQVDRFKQVQELQQLWLTAAGEHEIDLKRVVDAGELPPIALENILMGKTVDGDIQPENHLAGKDIMDSIRIIIDEINAIEKVLMSERISDNEFTASLAKRVLAIGTLLALLIGFIVIRTLTISLMGQLGAEPSELNKIALAISQGDFSQTIYSGVDDDNLAGHIQKMSYNIEKLITESQLKADIIDVIPTPILTVDTNQNITIINKSGADFFGKSITECTGKNRNSIIRSADNTAAGITQSISSGKTVTTRSEVYDSSNSAIPVLSTSAALKENDSTIVGAVEYFTNLSQITSVKNEVRQSVETLSIAIEQLNSMASGVDSGTQSIAEITAFVASSAEELGVSMGSMSSEMNTVNDNLSNVSNAAKEMNTTINMIASSAEETRQTTSDAVDSVNKIESRIDELQKASEGISSVITTIMEIADQTTLLALNATIEAARAGDAGKGFAVVADEVKTLAKQTNYASQEIKNGIDQITIKTSNTIDEVRSIHNVFKNVNSAVTSIASAVEQQSTTTHSITQNINTSAGRTESISSSISESVVAAETIAKEIATVSADIDEVNQSSVGLSNAVNSLSDVSSNLQVKVHKL